jgi:hypothetical protein
MPNQPPVPRLLVVGSANTDMVVKTARFPQPLLMTFRDQFKKINHGHSYPK